MENWSYEIEKVKQYFLYSLFAPPWDDYSKYWESLKSTQFIKESLVTSLIGTLLFLFLTTYIWISLLNSWVPWFMYVIVLFPGLLMTPWFYQEYKKTWNYAQLQKYFSLKSTLTPFLAKFKSSIEKDIFTEWINVLEIDDIRKTMNNISRAIRLISWPLLNFRKIKGYLSPEAKNVLERFISIEMQWLSEYIEVFQKILSLWIAVHSQELTEYNRQLLKGENNAILDLASIRLQTHIENIEKVRTPI